MPLGKWKAMLPKAFFISGNISNAMLGKISNRFRPMYTGRKIMYTGRKNEGTGRKTLHMNF
ncbi:hypothetical protein C7475_1011537 [Chitinophaga sp. S165]|nr:hypothetical protein C7475_1011537 [Chitinophaga sp. S165]